ncbi:MAG: 50S ribosomal protein L30 [Candidatus Sumerlaeia bacterium]|nr:50S ribosomal protein L30 [Candidatus Sumerlaeia bacterium]
MARVRVTWVRSTINRSSRHERTIRALGLKRLQHTVEHELTPQIQGMINQVNYLVSVEPVRES